MNNASKLWFQPGREGWDPRAYEWYFRKTPLGAAIRAREEQAVFGLLGDVLEPHHSVLEIGCGTGNYTIPLARRCAKVVAVDSSTEMLQYLRESLDQEDLANVEARLGWLPDGIEASREFDGALAIGILNYVEGLEESLQTLVSALKPGGWAVFNVPLTTVEGRIYALQELAGRRRINSLSAEEIIDLTKSAGLDVQRTTPAGLSRGGLTLMVGAASPPER